MEKESSRQKKSNFVLTAEWNFVTCDYKLMKYLGEGSFGQVIKAQNLHTGKIVAIKFINNIFRDVYHAKKVVREIEILRHMSCMADTNQFTTKLVDLIVPVST